MDSVDWHASPARDDVIGEVSDSVAKPLKLSISISASISSDGGYLMEAPQADSMRQRR